MSWTVNDERRLRQLTDRKARLQEEVRLELAALVSGFYYRGIDADDVVEALLSSADAYIAALQRAKDLRAQLESAEMAVRHMNSLRSADHG